MSRIGLIGLGLMGQALAERLILAGNQVFGFDVDAQRNAELLRLGGAVLQNPRSVAAQSDHLVLSLPNSSIVTSVLQECGDALEGKRVIDTTTGDPETSAETGRRLAERDATYLDATVVGSSRQVRSGEVIVLAGGDESAFHEVLPLLSSFARHAYHLGPCGSGARMKLVVNLVLGLNRAVLAEGLSFAKACGIEPSQALQVLQASMAYSRIMDTKGRKMVDRDWSTEAKLAQHHKDVRLILDAASRAGMPLPLTRLHDQLLDTAEAMGLADADNSAILEVYGQRGSQSDPA